MTIAASQHHNHHHGHALATASYIKTKKIHIDATIVSYGSSTKNRALSEPKPSNLNSPTSLVAGNKLLRLRSPCKCIDQLRSDADSTEHREVHRMIGLAQGKTDESKNRGSPRWRSCWKPRVGPHCELRCGTVPVKSRRT